jgi:hypothetical protein
MPLVPDHHMNQYFCFDQFFLSKPLVGVIYLLAITSFKPWGCMLLFVIVCAFLEGLVVYLYLLTFFIT